MSVVIVVIEAGFSEVKVEESYLMSLPPAHPPKWRGSLALPFPFFLYPLLGPPFSFLSSCLSDQKEAKG